MPKELDANEIRDYIQRAPQRKRFDGQRIVWNTATRYKWLADISRGSIDERINRRAGIVFEYVPWKPDPVYKAVQRHRFREWQKSGVTPINRRL
jgi:hypothetical protein